MGHAIGIERRGQDDRIAILFQKVHAMERLHGMQAVHGDVLFLAAAHSPYLRDSRPDRTKDGGGAFREVIRRVVDGVGRAGEIDMPPASLGSSPRVAIKSV